MNFNEIAQVFAKGPSGTDQFKAFYKSAFQLMKTDPQNAALYFVVAVAAHNYVIMYEDQGVETAFADQAHALLNGFNRRVMEALPLGAEHRLQAASSLALDYEWNVKEF